MGAAPYDLPVGWYLWIVIVVAVLALIMLGVILIQRRRRAGGVLSVRPRSKRRPQ
jgi:preprotein translocase subunit SecG